jgi:hypothetical protein
MFVAGGSCRSKALWFLKEGYAWELLGIGVVEQKENVYRRDRER